MPFPALPLALAALGGIGLVLVASQSSADTPEAKAKKAKKKPKKPTPKTTPSGGGTVPSGGGTPPFVPSGGLAGPTPISLAAGLPLDLKQEVLKILELLTVDPSTGAIMGPITEEAIRRATELAGRLEDAGFPGTAEELRGVINRATKFIPAPPKAKQIPLPGLPPILVEQINKAIAVERDPKKLQAIVDALKKLPQSPERDNAIQMLTALIVQVKAKQAEDEALRKVEEVIKSPGVPAPLPPPATPTLPKPTISTKVRPTLRSGSRGPDVVFLQNLLNSKHGSGLKADGIFGPLTLSAVKSFQKTHPPLVVDGIVGPKTWGVLEAVPAFKVSPPPLPPPPPQVTQVSFPTVPTVSDIPKPPTLTTVRSGSTGPVVVYLQTSLNMKRGEALTTDGKFGPLTLAAAKRFQQSQGLVVDGIVGPKSWGALEAIPFPGAFASTSPGFAGVYIGGTDETVARKTELEMAAEALAGHLLRLQKKRPNDLGKGKEDKQKIARFERLAGLPITAKVSPAVVLRLADFVSELPIIMYWPEAADDELVFAVKNALVKKGRHAAAESEQGQGRSA